MSEPVKYILRLILFSFVQLAILSKVPPLHYAVTPYLYFLFLVWLPFSFKGPWLIVMGFVSGFIIDVFLNYPGLHASAALWVAFLRTPLIQLLVPKDTRELKSGSPGIHSMGISAYAVFVLVITLVHHIWLVMLEWMYFGNIWYFIQKVVMSTLVSLLLIAITEMLFRPIRKRRIG